MSLALAALAPSGPSLTKAAPAASDGAPGFAQTLSEQTGRAEAAAPQLKKASVPPGKSGAPVDEAQASDPAPDIASVALSTATAFHDAPADTTSADTADADAPDTAGITTPEGLQPVVVAPPPPPLEMSRRAWEAQPSAPDAGLGDSAADRVQPLPPSPAEPLPAPSPQEGQPPVAEPQNVAPSLTAKTPVADRAPWDAAPNPPPIEVPPPPSPTPAIVDAQAQALHKVAGLRAAPVVEADVAAHSAEPAATDDAPPPAPAIAPLLTSARPAKGPAAHAPQPDGAQPAPVSPLSVSAPPDGDAQPAAASGPPVSASSNGEAQSAAASGPQVSAASDGDAAPRPTLAGAAPAPSDRPVGADTPPAMAATTSAPAEAAATPTATPDPITPPPAPAPAPSTSAAAFPLGLMSTLSQATIETTTRLAAQIAARLEGRSTRFDMVLTPEDLGRVEVSLEIDDTGQLAARLAFDNPAAAADLRGRADELRRQLQDAGFQIAGDGLDFSHRDDGRGGEPGGGLFERRGRSSLFSGASRLAAEADISAAPPPGAWINLSLARERVDLKV